MLSIRVVTTHGKPFRRFGRDFSSTATVLTVGGEGADITPEQYAQLKRAAIPCPVQVRHGEDPQEGGILDIVELGEDAKAPKAKAGKSKGDAE